LHCQEKKFPENSLYLPQTKSINSTMYGGSRIHNQISKLRLGFWSRLIIKPGLKSIFFNKGNYFWFNLVFIKKKKVTRLNFFFKRLKSNKNRFKSVYLGFFWFCLVFSVWLGFFPLFSVWVRFSFFGFRLIKPKPNLSVFFNFNWFFFTVQFF
jgi:hypothetical protein